MKKVKIGDSLLFNADCMKVMPLLPANKINLILCDLPYGELALSKKGGGLRLIDRGDANTCNLDLDKVMSEFNRLCSGSIYAFCGLTQVSKLCDAAISYKMTVRLGVWDKSNPSPMNGTRLWLSGLEYCVFARKPNATFTEHCKKPLWRFPSGTSKTHPTQKPLKLMTRLLLASSKVGDRVLDNCMGSGTTGVAAVYANRKFIGIEQSKEYFDICCDRVNEAHKEMQYRLRQKSLFKRKS